MTGAYWEHTKGKATLRVDPRILSMYLVDQGGPPVSAIAERGARIARDTVRDPSAERMIRHKTYTQSPQHAWHLKSGRLPDLIKALSIPVALIVNDSNYALEYEVGSGAIGTSASRPLMTAYTRLRSLPGVRGVRMLLRNSPAGSFRKEYNNTLRRRNTGRRR